MGIECVIKSAVVIRRGCLSFACFLLVCIVLRAQNNSLSFKHINVNTGLSQGDVRTIFQDGHGFLWFGTWDGLNRYNGFTVETFKEQYKNEKSLKGQLINNIVQIDEHRLGIATFKGLNIYDDRNETFDYYSPQQKLANIRIIKRENHLLFLMIDDDLFSFDINNKKFKKIDNLLSRQLEDLFVTGKIGFNRSDKIVSNVYKFLSEFPEHFDEIKKVLSETIVNDVLVDKKSKHIHIISDNGYYIYSLETFVIIKQLLYSPVKCFAKHKNFLLVGTEFNGLYIFDSATLKITEHYKHTENINSIGGNYIISFFIDKNNNLWCGLVGNGASYCSLNPKPAKTIFTSSSATKQRLKNNNFVALSQFKNGELWAVDINGNIMVLDEEYHLVKTITPTMIDPALSSVFVQDMIETDDRNIYLLTDKGVYVSVRNYKFKKITASYLKENQRYGQGIVTLNDTLGLIGTRDGLLYFHLKKHEIINRPCQIEQKSNIYNLLKGDGNLFFANSFFKGLRIYTHFNDNFKLLHEVKSDFNVHDVQEMKDTILVATTKGLLILNRTNFNFNIIDESDGLPNQNLYSVLPDKNEKGSFWCSSNKGIFKYNIYNQNIKPFGLNDGLNAFEFNSQAIAIRPNGDYVFGSTDGITILHPYANEDLYQNSTINLYNLKASNVPASDYWDIKAQSYNIPYEKNDISFTLINFNYPNSTIQFTYKLEGYDDKNYIAKNPAELRYSDLPIGNYELMVKYPGPTTKWTILANINILAPWYRKWWAKMLFMLGSLVVAGSFLRLYINVKLTKQKAILDQQKALDSERLRISAELHDDIGSTLSSIAIYSELAENLLIDKPLKSKELVHKIKLQSQNLMDRTGEIIWSLKPSMADSYTIKNKISELIKILFTGQNTTFNIQIDPNIGIHIPDPNIRKNLLLIINEVIHNIAQHTKATEVSISLQVEENFLILDLIDNGLVSESDSFTREKSLYKLKNRCEDLNGRFYISNSPLKGTKIRFSIPMPRIRHDFVKK